MSFEIVNVTKAFGRKKEFLIICHLLLKKTIYVLLLVPTVQEKAHLLRRYWV